MTKPAAKPYHESIGTQKSPGRRDNMDDALFAARLLLENITPMKRDCGKICDAACCRAPEGETAGMLLFPGEEEAYRGREGWRIERGADGPLVVCPGACDRAERPLACRIFPLVPVRKDGEIRAVTDLGARGVCPLARQGKSALDPAFTEAVRKAGELLDKSPEQAAFLDRLTARQAEWKQLIGQFGGKGHV